LGDLIEQNPDFLLQIAMGYLAHLEAPLPQTQAIEEDDDEITSTNSMTGIGAAPRTGATTLGYGFGGGPVQNQSKVSKSSTTTTRAFGAGGRAGMTIQSVTAGMMTLSGGIGGTGTDAGGVTSRAISDTTMDVPPAVQSGLDLLKRILKIVPGCISAYVHIARCLSCTQNFDQASRALRKCLQLQPHCSPALLALGRVETMRLNPLAADRALEQAVSADFGIRHLPMYKLIMAIIRAQQNRSEEAIAETETLLTVQEVTHPHASNIGGSNIDSLTISDDDRVSVFVVHAQLLSRLRRLKEAHKVLQDAKVIFAGTPQQLQVLVASAQLAVDRGDHESAIRTLDKITPDNTSFVRAQLLKVCHYYSTGRIM
jgi:tetratricopeptide (TPR) repeat protein